MLDDLWRSLQTAIAQPEAAELAPLWQALEIALAPLPQETQLRVAAEAIAQIAEVYAVRAEVILSNLDGEPTPTEPILGADFLAGLVKQSTSLNLDALVEAAPAERRSRISNPIDSVAGVIDKQTLLDALDTMQPLAVVHAENVGDWSKAVASYLATASRHFANGCSTQPQDVASRNLDRGAAVWTGQTRAARQLLSS